MTTDGAIRPPLTKYAPGSVPRQNVAGMSRRLAGRFAGDVATGAALPGGSGFGRVTRLTRTCLTLAVDMLCGTGTPEKLDRFAATAADWAGKGIPIDIVQHAVHEGFTTALEQVSATASGRERSPHHGARVAAVSHDDFDSLLGRTRLVVEMLDAVTTVVSMAYVREARAAVDEHHTAVHTLTSALLSGNALSAAARAGGIAVADRYFVIALEIPRHPDEDKPALDSQVVARRKLRRLQAELATRCDDTALALLSVDGGTVLIPGDSLDGDALDSLLPALSSAGQIPVTGAVVTAAPADIPAAADQAHDVLDMVCRLGAGPGLYRFTDVALEYQLTRPGPGSEFLGALLDPIDDYPELVQTLQCHIRNNRCRQHTARDLNIHTNTVDYRLKRIAQLTGLDPSVPSGLWNLRSALIAREFRRTPARQNGRIPGLQRLREQAWGA